MSEIPIGSPPAPPGRHAAPSGWYPDPANPTAERWWDGWQWSRTTRAREDIPRPYPAPAYPGYAPVPAYPVAAYAGVGGKAVTTADGVPLAGWWLRVLAVVIDAVIVGLVAGLASFPVLSRVVGRMVTFFRDTLATGAPPPSPPSAPAFLTPGESLVLTAVQLAVGLAYHVLFLRYAAATPGKLVVGLRVVPVDRGHHPGRLAWGAVVVRALVWVGPMVHAALFAVRLVDVGLPLWQPKRQALHDLAARTQVVRTR